MSASTPSSPSVAATCAVVGRPPGEPNARCTSAATVQPSADRGQRAVGERGAEVQRRDRHQQHEELAEPAHRSRQVRRRHRDDRHDDRDPHRGEARRVVAEAGHDVEALLDALAFSTTSAPMKRASTQVSNPPMARSRARRQRRATTAATTTRPTAQSAPTRRSGGRTTRAVGEAVDGAEEVLLELGSGRPGARSWRRRSTRRRRDGSSRSCGAGRAAPTRGRTSARATSRSATAGSSGDVGHARRSIADPPGVSGGGRPPAADAGRAWPRSRSTSCAARRRGCGPTASRSRAGCRARCRRRGGSRSPP